ncbi:hypothetical protein [Taklimakanibacter deserti]|uniref:hypothetical protein n=1 Tax=Taklimakanibacter deserti TaxID=2267839 RepID=UPI0013C3FA2C
MQLKRPDFISYRKRAATFVVAGLGAGAAAVASFSAALYHAAHPDQLPVVAAGEALDTGRFTVTLLDAKFGKEGNSSSSTKGARLAVEMELTNRSAATSNAYMRLLTITNAPTTLDPPSFYLARDNAILFDLHPNMPERVIATWYWPAQAAPPKSVEFSVASQIHKRRDNLYGAPGWFDRPPVAKVVLPVKTEAAP